MDRASSKPSLNDRTGLKRSQFISFEDQMPLKRRQKGLHEDNTLDKEGLDIVSDADREYLAADLFSEIQSSVTSRYSVVLVTASAAKARLKEIYAKASRRR